MSIPGSEGLRQLRDRIRRSNVGSVLDIFKKYKVTSILVAVFSTIIATYIITITSITESDIQINSFETTDFKIGREELKYDKNECGVVKVRGEITMDVYNGGFDTGSLSKAEIEVRQFTRDANVKVTYLDKSPIDAFQTKKAKLKWIGVIETLSKPPKWDITVYDSKGNSIKTYTFGINSNIPDKLIDCM